MQEEYINDRAPRVSVVVIVYNMAREAPRTLYSLSAAYQRDIGPEDFEIIVVDNGSNPPFDPTTLDALTGNFRLIRLHPAPSSPAHAINIGLSEAKGSVIGVMIDGARIVTPGLLHFARTGVGLYPRAIVATLGWYLGYDQQRWALEGGYTKAREDKILDDIAWKDDGYRLFDVSAGDETTVDGWFGNICESNALFMSRESWELLGGVDERFDVPGGGFLNLDLMIEALDLQDSKLVVLLGEGTFHQLHGGIATNASPRAISASVDNWRAQYEAIRGRTWAPPVRVDRTYLGVLPRAPLARFARAVVEPAVAAPLGYEFDRIQWALSRSPPPSDAVTARLLELAKGEVAARRFEAAAVVARIARSHAPDDVAIQRTISLAGAWLRGPADIEDIGADKRGAFFLAQANAYSILGQRSEAEGAFLTALQYEPDLVGAHLGLASLRMPGDGYLQWLRGFHSTLRPETYLELGIGGGQSLSMADPPTRAIAVDPQAHVGFPLRTETRIFCETNDQFFQRPDLDSIFHNQQIGLVFISAAHSFQSALETFSLVERYCASRSVVLLHNTIPLDEITQLPERQRRFYTGDTWKAVVGLRAVRPDLNVVTIPTSPTGLTVITGLDPNSTLLSADREQILARLSALTYAELCRDMPSLLNIIDNDIGGIAELLSGVL